MRIVMFFANSDQTHPGQNSGISWARSNVLPWIQRSAAPFVVSLVLPSLQQLPAVLSWNRTLKANMKRLLQLKKKR